MAVFLKPDRKTDLVSKLHQPSGLGRGHQSWWTSVLVDMSCVSAEPLRLVWRPEKNPNVAELC